MTELASLSLDENSRQGKSRWDSSDEEDNEGQSSSFKKRLIDESPVEYPQKIPKLVEVNAAINEDNNINIVVSDQVDTVAQESALDKIELNPDSVAADSECSVTKNVHVPLFHGCRSVENYQRLRYIDQGTYGMVFKARCKETGNIVALKQVKLGKEESRHGFPITALRETNILLSLKHPNIVSVKEMVVGGTTDKVYMVMEYMEHDLKSCIGQMNKPFAMAEVYNLNYIVQL